VEEYVPDIDGQAMVGPFITVWSAGCAWTADGMALSMGKELSEDQFEILTWALCGMGREQTASGYLMAVTALQAFARQVARMFIDYDIWLTPTLAEPPVPLGTFESTPENPIYGLMRAADFVPFTPVCNVTGQPAMNVPLYWNEEGLPIGTHYIAHFGDEATLFRLASQLEEARPWADRRPPVSA
jgi:amidase